METKTLNEWMRTLGWRWNPGEEQMYKSQFTKSEAQDLLAGLHLQGAVTRA